MAKVPDGKAILYVYISRETDRKLRQLIVRKYGEFRRGYLSYEVECALQAWLSAHKSTQIDPGAVGGRVNPLPMYYRVWRKVKEFIAQRYGVDFNEVHQVPARFVEEAIAFIRGTDKRTIKKWLEVFVAQGLIKYVDAGVVEVLG